MTLKRILEVIVYRAVISPLVRQNGPKRRLKRRNLTVNPLRPNLFRLLRRRLVRIFLDSGLQIDPKDVCGVVASLHSNPICSSATRCRLGTRSRCGSHSKVAIDCRVPVLSVGILGIFLQTVTSRRGEVCVEVLTSWHSSAVTDALLGSSPLGTQVL